VIQAACATSLMPLLKKESEQVRYIYKKRTRVMKQRVKSSPTIPFPSAINQTMEENAAEQ